MEDKDKKHQPKNKNEWIKILFNLKSCCIWWTNDDFFDAFVVSCVFDIYVASLNMTGGSHANITGVCYQLSFGYSNLPGVSIIP